MTTPLTDEQIDKLAHRHGQVISSWDSDRRFSKTNWRAFARALLAQPSVAPPALGGDVLKELVAAAQIFLTLNNACAGAGRLDRALDALHATQAPTAAQGQDAAPAEQPQAVELLDERGEIRRDLKSSAYCVGNEYKPFHPSASHVRPEWRDGWNACFAAAIRAARAKE